MPDPEGRRRPDPRLLPDEIDSLRSLFVQTVDLDKVRVVFGGILTVGGYARTLGNTIAFPDAYRTGYRCLERRCWLVHEVAHVWQNQVLGKRYIPGALWEHLTLRDPYAFELFPEQPFLSYGYEAQASLVAELYRLRVLGMPGPRRERLEQLLGELYGITRLRRVDRLA
jgi:hypothetical protein